MHRGMATANPAQVTFFCSYFVRCDIASAESDTVTVAVIHVFMPVVGYTSHSVEVFTSA